MINYIALFISQIMIVFHGYIRLVPVRLLFLNSAIFTQMCPLMTVGVILFCTERDSVVQKLAARWPGHSYHWPRLAECQNTASIRLGGGGSAIVKWMTLPWGGVFRVSRRWLPKNNWCTENLSFPVSRGGSTDFFKSVGSLRKALVSVFSAVWRRLELIPR